MIEKRYDTLLFDLDGTLTDSARGIHNSFRYALKALDRPEPTAAQLSKCVGPPLWESFETQFGLTGDMNKEAVRQYRVYYEAGGIFENSVYDGVPQMLSALRERGYRLIVASSKKEESVIRVLDHFDLLKYFDLPGGSDENVNRISKSQVIAYIIDLTGLDRDRALMIGDREHDIIGARAHGIDSMGALWGYGSMEELKAAGATYIAASPADVTAALPGAGTRTRHGA